MQLLKFLTFVRRKACKRFGHDAPSCVIVSIFFRGTRQLSQIEKLAFFCRIEVTPQTTHCWRWKWLKAVFFSKGDRRSFGRGTLVAGQPTDVGERSVGCPPYKSTCGIFYLTDINMWYQVYLMNKHQEFLKFEAVLAHCEKWVPEGSLFAAMEYGREMQFFDGHNSLSASGQLLAEMLIQSTRG